LLIMRARHSRLTPKTDHFRFQAIVDRSMAVDDQK
jgi:hypothetical protein